MATFDAAFDPVSRQVWRRLLVACALSLLLHVAVLHGIPVRPPGGLSAGIPVLSARLEPGPDHAPEQEIVPAVVAENPNPAPRNTVVQPSAKRAGPRTSAASPAVTSGVELEVLRDPIYYPARQLDVYPRPLTPFKLDYPAAAAVTRGDGRLLVILLIDEFGVVNDASIVEAEPRGYFEDATLAVLRAARFSPAQKQGKPVKSRALLQVNYIYGDNQGAVR